MKLYKLLYALLPLLLSVAFSKADAADDELPIKIQLYPKAIEKPALKYKLLPSRLEQIAGNAAVYYGKVKAEQNAFFSNRELRENIDRWQSTPLEELLAEDARVPSNGSIDFFLDRGARCRYCDWQLPIGDVQYFSTLLPEMQETRAFSRILTANARIDIAHQRYDSALHRFRTNYSLGRHVAQGECVVCGLIGIAICGSTNAQLLEFVQQPNSPNLYWTLTDLPSPMVDLSPTIKMESIGLELSYPELTNYQGVALSEYASERKTDSELWLIPPARRTAEGWQQLFFAIRKDLDHTFSDDNTRAIRTPQQFEKDYQKSFPHIREFLKDSGLDGRELEEMPLYQAALLYLLRSNRLYMDEMAKFYSLPYPKSILGMNRVIEEHSTAMRRIPIELRFGSHAVKAIKVAREAQTRLEREIAVLRAFEALRIYGASHAGKLPETWSDVTEVPIPIDPVTGEAFEYQLEGDVATLRSPELRGRTLHYEIRMVQP